MPHGQEIEAKFLEVDVGKVTSRLHELGATDLGLAEIEEVIIYDKDLTWIPQERMIRLRKMRDKIVLTYKFHRERTITGVEEVEVEVSDYTETIKLLEHLGFFAYREQQKKRHSYLLDGVCIEIDTWPGIPTYVEIEGDDPEIVRTAASKLGFSWDQAVFSSAGKVIEERYQIPVGKYRYFTFDRLGT